MSDPLMDLAARLREEGSLAPPAYYEQAASVLEVLVDGLVMLAPGNEFAQELLSEARRIAQGES